MERGSFDRPNGGTLHHLSYAARQNGTLAAPTLTVCDERGPSLGSSQSDLSIMFDGRRRGDTSGAPPQTVIKKRRRSALDISSLKAYQQRLRSELSAVETEISVVISEQQGDPAKEKWLDRFETFLSADHTERLFASRSSYCCRCCPIRSNGSTAGLPNGGTYKGNELGLQRDLIDILEKSEASLVVDVVTSAVRILHSWMQDKIRALNQETTDSVARLRFESFHGALVAVQLKTALNSLRISGEQHSVDDRGSEVAKHIETAARCHDQLSTVLDLLVTHPSVSNHRSVWLAPISVAERQALYAIINEISNLPYFVDGLLKKLLSQPPEMPVAINQQ